jgi:hypothetical protein
MLRCRGHEERSIPEVGQGSILIEDVGVLARIAIRGFKAISSSGWVELTPLTVFIGRNGSGKSSFIEALQWLQEAERNGLASATVERFHSFDDLRNKRTARMSIELELQERSAPSVRYGLVVKQGTPGRPVVENEWCSEGQTKATRRDIWTKKEGRGPAVRSILGANPVSDGDELALRSVGNTKAKGAERLRFGLQFGASSHLANQSPYSVISEGFAHGGIHRHRAWGWNKPYDNIWLPAHCSGPPLDLFRRGSPG